MGKVGNYSTLKDVAERAGTSAGTVSYILNGNNDRYISDKLREKVEAAAHELNYVRCAPASGLRGKKRGIIAITVPQYTNIFFSRIILAVESIMLEHGYILSVCNTYDDVKREKNVLDIMLSQRVDGFILIPTENGYDNFEMLRKLNLPYVVTERPISNLSEQYDYISADNYSAGKVATEKLLENGHEKIGFIRWGSKVSNLSDRLNAYRETMKEHGLKVDERYILAGEFSIKAGYELTEALLKKNPDLTAIIYEEHVMAQGGVQYLHESRHAIPDDISVIVIGSPEWVKSNNPPITCVNMREEDIGRLAAETLLQRMEGKATDFVSKRFRCTLTDSHSVKKIN